jgi:glycosyltransferase involved in cell wall biosynthesis
MNRVGLVVNSLGGGGAERVVQVVGSHWPSGGSEATIVVSTLHGDPEAADRAVMPLDRSDPSVVVIGFWPSPRNSMRVIRRMRTIVRERRFDALLVNSWGLSHLILLARWAGAIRCAVMVVEHNTLSAVLAERFPSRPVRALVRTLTRWLYRHADALIGVSDGVARDLEHTLDLPTGTVTTIHNPVDTDAIHTATHTPPPDELRSHFESLPRPIILTIGRLVPQKAHTDLIDAFAALPDHQRGTLVILGEGPLRTTLETRIHDLGLDQHTWLPGFVDNPWWFLARADLFALTSHYEGHPRSLLEALACRTPIVATDCPSGPREILHDLPGTTLVPVADIPAITHAITAHLTNPQRPDPDLTPHHPTTTAHHYERIILDRARQRPR